MKKDTIIYLILAIIIVLIIAVIFLIKQDGDIDEELAKCIAQKSELYVQLGCGDCKAQEEIFGGNYPYLNIIDCTYQPQKCVDAQITGTPTWIINGQKTKGVQTAEELKELTGC